MGTTNGDCEINWSVKADGHGGPEFKINNGRKWCVNRYNFGGKGKTSYGSGAGSRGGRPCC